MNYYLPLLLDGPMQSWGSASRFQRRTTGLYPTKSGVIGLICAAMGWAKRPLEEDQMLHRLAELRMNVVLMPRPARWNRQAQRAHPSDWLEVLRLEDYHTVGGGFDPKTHPESIPPTAKREPSKHATVSRREYLLDARFGVILAGQSDILNEAAKALRDPVWGVWLGRKSCIPAAPVLADDPFQSREQAWTALLKAAGLPLEIPFGAFGSVEEVAAPSEGHITVMDQPVSFGDGKSSGPDVRHFVPRWINVRVGGDRD